MLCHFGIIPLSEDLSIRQYFVPAALLLLVLVVSALL
jgi:hypothetical protein